MKAQRMGWVILAGSLGVDFFHRWFDEDGKRRAEIAAGSLSSEEARP